MKTLLAEAAAEAAGGEGGEGGGSRAVVFANTKRAVAEIGVLAPALNLSLTLAQP